MRQEVMEGGKPHDGVGNDGSFRVGEGTGVAKPNISDEILAEGVPARMGAEFTFPEVSNRVRALAAQVGPNE